ncbi:IclR family transcriptional regulator [Halobiforma nitratireducens]|uniref:Transcriptional regulator n=1 Tax=Halobiforma nitratireducens JCM 10879 TaxID=1227454 RepID=M0MLL5_9EURY|nr:IclR family transcriptional regulator [Halobiforma nitratireducens]EMA46572.1 transcriptional regulator [Halobiforma nitratireducens JCM 10879]
MSEQTTEGTIEATVRSFAVLHVLVDTPHPVGVTEIASRTNMTKSTAYKHVRTLVSLGYAEPVGTQYRPSVRLLDCARRLEWNNELIRTVRDPVDELAEMANEVAGLVVEREGAAVDVYCADQYYSGTFPAYNTRHLHCSAAGKAILAELPEHRVDSILETCPALTEHTITDREELLSELERVRERGFSLDRQEQFQNVNSVAVSVQTEDIVAAVYVSGQADELSGKRFEENIPGLLLSASRMLTSALE